MDDTPSAPSLDLILSEKAENVILTVNSDSPANTASEVFHIPSLEDQTYELPEP